MSNAPNLSDQFYGAYKAANASFNPDTFSCAEDTTAELLEQATTSDHPGMLLGKVQSGKTRTFISIVALAFDSGFDVAIVLSKNSKALIEQTAKRLNNEFNIFIDDGELDKLTIALGEWGKMDSPFRAYYGQIKLMDVAAWAPHGRALLARNLRFFRGATEVNDGMEKTVLKDPERFWYFNNGITLLCNKVQKTLLNADARDYGVFDCEGVSIVNGAQTVGVVWELHRKNPNHLATLDSRVNVRIISLENCPEGFATDVTRATNTQNRIQNRDFAALDPNQQRLAIEMSMDGRRYAFKSGDPDPKNGEGCNIEEATVALACANEDVTVAVQAKREVGALWYDIEKAPYTTLFNEQLNAQPTMWRAVLILREVQRRLGEIDKTEFPRGDLLAVHGNRFILHRVFLDPSVKKFRDPQADESLILEYAREATDEVLKTLSELVQARHPNAYLANLFKNTHKCKKLDQKMSNSEEEPEADPEPPQPEPSQNSQGEIRSLFDQ